MGELESLKNELKQANDRIAKLKSVIAKHPAARIGRIVKLVLFAGGGAVLIAAAIGFSFGEASVAIQIFVGILLVMPETLGAAAATDAAKSFASSMGSTLGKTIGKKKE